MLYLMKSLITYVFEQDIHLNLHITLYFERNPHLDNGRVLD